MPMIVKRLAVAGTLLTTVVATMAGCWNPSTVGGPEVPAGPPEVHAAWTSCADEVPKMFVGAEATGLPRLDDSFAATAAIVCGSQPERCADGGQDLVGATCTSNSTVVSA